MQGEVNSDASLITTNTVLTSKELANAVDTYKSKGFFQNLIPILPQERTRFGYFVSMFSMISFTYTFLRVFKDRVVLSVLDNVETKNWLKLFTFLATQLFVIVSQNISSRLDFNQAFTTLTMIFMGCLGANALLMNFSQYFQLNDLFTDKLFTADNLSVRGLKFIYPFFLIVNQIWFSLFYILAEVIGSMMVSFCFMTYVNTNTSEGQNKRFVRVLYAFSNVTSTLAAVLSKYWNRYYANRPKEDIDKYFLIFPMIIIGIYAFILFLKTKLEVELKNQIVITGGTTKKAGSKKAKIGFKDSIYLMFNSKLLLCMSGLSLFYNISSNLFDNSNTAGISAAASYYNEDKASFASSYKEFDTTFSGFLTTIIILSPLSSIIDTHGILLFSMAPLIIVFFSTFVTFAMSTMNFPLTGKDFMWPLNKLSIHMRNPKLECITGTIIQMLVKVSKYAFYDIVKEAVSMKIESDLRPLFKGVFDGSMAKFGKCVGSIYGIVMSGIFVTNDNRYYFPITALILMMFCGAWFLAIKYLNRSYNEAVENNVYMNPDFEEKLKL